MEPRVTAAILVWFPDWCRTSPLRELWGKNWANPRNWFRKLFCVGRKMPTFVAEPPQGNWLMWETRKLLPEGMWIAMRTCWSPSWSNLEHHLHLNIYIHAGIHCDLITYLPLIWSFFYFLLRTTPIPGTGDGSMSRLLGRMPPSGETFAIKSGPLKGHQV